MTVPCVCTTVRKANRALFRYYENAMAESGVSVVQFAILRSLERNGEMTLSHIAAEQVMERTSLYRTIAPLLDNGTIQLRDADRGRAKVAALTRQGRRTVRDALPHWESAQQAVVSRLGNDEWQRLSTILLEIPALLRAADSAGG